MATWSLLRERPRLLERAYVITRALLWRCAPLLARVGHARADRWLAGPEALTKGWIFGCQMCGQCVLHETGMTCPMTCPKRLRNGPCGGVRPDGSCELSADTRCVWVQAIERGLPMTAGAQALARIQPPLDHRLAGHSAWVRELVAEGRLPAHDAPGERS